MPTLRRAAFRALCAFALGLTAPHPAPAETASGILKRVIAAACGPDALSGFDIQSLLPGSWLLDESRDTSRAPAERITHRLALPGGAQLLLERFELGGQLRQFRASYWSRSAGAGALAPRMQASADGSCRPMAGRVIRADGPAWQFLDQLEADLETVQWSETLQAPWPDGRDPGGIRVALVDSGLAYDLPLFRGRLARGGDGTPLGYDFWDMDPWPYDGDTSRGPFLPIRHGTAVASVLAREAPDAVLVPFRYPRPDMSRMADLVDRAAAAGARIIAMPLGSNRAEDWDGFAAALQRHDMLAIVSAGNNGRDIDKAPVYPAALALDQILTVTSSDRAGRLAPGSNWGARHVDLMVPAEMVPVVDFRGAQGVGAGSSYAVPRLAALAARLLQAEPDLDASELKSQVLARATNPAADSAGMVAEGFIADPSGPLD